MKLETIFKKIEDSHSKYQGEIGRMEAALQDLADFEVAVEYQPSDGFVVGDEHSNLAGLDKCIEIIRNTGKLSHEDYLEHTI